MLNFSFDEALTIVDYYNPSIRSFRRLSKEEIWAIANKAVKERGKDWVLLTLSHDRKLNELAVLSWKQMNTEVTGDNSTITKRREQKKFYEEQAAVFWARHKETLQQERNQRRYIKQLQRA